MNKTKNIKRIGILGGTFNPVHLGHLNLARAAIKKLSLNKVFFVPAYIPPHKKIENSTGPEDRIRMVRAAIKNQRHFCLSLYEVRKLRKSYSIETLKYFKKRFGRETKLFFLIGADSLIGIHSWRHIDEALEISQFVVVNRPDYSFGSYPKNIKKITIPGKDISSTRIRALIKEGKSIRGLLPIEVEKYIRKKRLYS